MAHPIPEWWCKAVVKALDTNDPHIIDWTPQAFQRWHADSFGALRPEAYEALILALSTPGIIGNETTSFPGQKATYEFLFRYETREMYGKIALKSDGVRILILSAHKPKRSSL